MSSHPSSLVFSRDPDGAHVLQAGQWVPVPRATVFPFFADPANLQAITPPHLAFRILTEGPLDMRPGLLIDYRLGLHGIPLRWRTRITAYEPGRGFTDLQERGPYRLWEHQHTFSDRDGGTWIADRIRYRLPWNFNLVHPLVNADLRAIFTFRQEEIARRFGSVARKEEAAPAVG
jgi:ligand-binding SRPBCC domain-containing protein